MSLGGGKSEVVVGDSLPPQEKYYEFCGMILRDGDTFEIQEEKPGENPYNPSGIGICTFNHKSWSGVKEVAPNK